MPVGYAAAASAAGSVLSGVIGAGAAKSAAAQQAAAQQNAMAFQSAMYANNLKLLAPYINQGYGAQNRVNAIFGLGGPAPAAAPAPTAAPTAAPAPAATPGAALASTGFSPSGSLPAGYSVQQVGGGEGEGPARMVVTNSTGSIVSELPGVALGDTAGANTAAISALQGQGLAPAAATPATPAAADAAPTMSLGNAGALAGPGSAVNPYAPPNGGVFTPTQGTDYGGFTFNPTVADLEATPGYQFMLAQGLKATQSSAAARGLGMSGAAIREAGQYATGRADSNWKDVFGAELSKYTTNRDTFANNFARQRQQFGANLDASLGLNQQFYNSNVTPLLNISAQGQAAVSGAANQGLASGGQISNALTGIGNAQAAGTVGSANALTAGLTGAGSSLQQAIFLNKLFGNGATPAAAAGGGIPSSAFGPGGTNFNAANDSFIA